MSDAPRLTRREILAGAAAAAGGALLSALPLAAEQAPTMHVPVTPAPASPEIPLDATKVLGTPTTALSERAPLVTAARTPVGLITGASNTPLHLLTGTITPSDLHFERHHGGVAHIDPSRYQLLVHGLVDRPMMFSYDDLRSMPIVTRTCFVECAGNGRVAYRAPVRELTPQLIDGTTSNSEWTGVLVSTLLREAGVKSSASWILAEGGDAAVLSRSIPLAKANDDAMIAIAQNGEPLRPAHGYPARLLLPGFEANMCIKWLRRLELISEPNMSRDETAKYTDPLPDGTARQFSFVMDVKSTLTYPTHPVRLMKQGWIQISGLAWSGRGKIRQVDVSVDGGRSWTQAALQGPVLPFAHTRFTLPWKWAGEAATIMSRATDETGAVQPTLAEFKARRGSGTDYHFNHIRAWDVQPDGGVFYGVGK